MNKIDEILCRLIEKEPTKEYAVIVVLDSLTNFDELNLKIFNRLMKNIIVSRLTGNEIIALSQNEAIISIELDREMGVL
jgi:hypothetical protein